MTEELDIENRPQERPVFLKVLCILTWISTGFSLIGAFIQLLMGPMTEEQLTESRVQMAEAISEMERSGMDAFSSFFEQAQGLSEDLQSHFYLAIAVAIISPLLGLFGALKMWQGRKIGFHLYIIYCLISIGGIYLYAHPSNIPTLSVVFGLIFSAGFVFMYSRNLNWMK